MNSADKLKLYPHNLEAALKVKEQFDDGGKVASILHATGTGKTYVALYLAMEYKQDKIVWLVSSNAIKEHIERTINDNPNISMERDFPNLEIRTYQSLVNLTERELEEIPCDFLITDEFHHLGAPVWGERVNTFIDTHEDMKTFGMTAYSVRDRGTVYERNMTNPETEEIFSDTVESVYDLYDALCDGILPKPIAKSVIIEDSEIIAEIKDRIEMLKRKGDESYLSYEKVLDNVIKLIHQQNGIKELICQSVRPGGKYIYFCPVYAEEGKNDIETIMESMRVSLRERYPNKKIVLYKSTSKDEDHGKHHRDCFYSDKDLSGNDASDAIKIIFVKNQYNEGVHAPNVDGVFLGRRTKSDIVAFEQIGRALSVREDTHDKLISPIIIDLADNIEYLEELETNLGDRIRERQTKGEGKQREIKITDATIDIDVVNKDLYSILRDIRTNLNMKTWDKYYELAVEYYKYHEDSEIPSTFKTINGYEYDENGVALGRWCNTQRTNQKNLSEERKKKLEAIKFRFESNKHELTWERKYQLLLAYYKYHGNSEIPSSFKTINGYEYDKNGVNLGFWCVTQRREQKKLSEERRKKLEAIKFRFETNKDELEWDKKYQLAVEYYKYHEDSEIPSTFKTINGYEYDENGVALGRWCNTQRTNQKNLSKERRKKLEAIKFRFEVRKVNDMEWDEWYQLAVAYYQHHGNSEISSTFKTINGYEYNENGVKLGIWCNTQRTNQKNLSEERRKKLEAIEFRFEVRKVNKLQWDEWYELAQIYYKHWGNSEIPSSFKTINGYEYDKNGVNLGFWCVTQRREQKKLSEERRKKLELIEFRFVTKEECILKKKELCSEYGIDYDKYEFLDKISYQELYSKIMYLVEKNYSLEDVGKLHEIFMMCNENMVLKYLISKEELIMNYYINNKGRGI